MPTKDTSTGHRKMLRERFVKSGLAGFHDYEIVELLRIRERNWNMLKILNIREGFGRGDDRPPNAWFKPLKIKGAQLESRLLDYYGHTELLRQDI